MRTLCLFVVFLSFAFFPSVGAQNRQPDDSQTPASQSQESAQEPRPVPSKISTSQSPASPPAAPPTDVAGWRSAKWGMTKAKVLEEFAAKGAAEVDGKISIRSYKVGPLEFRVAFVFGEEEEERVCPGEKGLCSIQLYGVGDTRLHGWTAFQGLEPQLIEKYGQPSYRTKNAWTERVENMGRGGTSWEMAGK